jgi:hypothetical protein
MPDHNTISPLPLGEGPGVRAARVRTVGNPYVQVALTYIRRPFSSWFGGLASVAFVGVFIAFSLLGRFGLKDSWAVQLMYFFSLFIFLAIHMKGQFVDSRAHLTPRFRRIHATIAALAALIAAVVLPTVLSWFMGWHCIGFVAVAVLLFGTILWVIVNDATWTVFAILAGWSALCATQSGPAYFRALLSGQIEPQAAAILVLGILIALLAGIRLVRLNDETMTYYSTLRWDWDWSQKTRQGWSGEGRFLPGLRDWIREREMSRLARLARQASGSWWSRICRWQVGMVAGWSLWFWVLGALICLQPINWWISTKTSKTAVAMMGLTSLVLSFMPAIATVGVLQWRTFKLGHESLLPVERNSYIRQLGTAAALSHFQLWAGMSVALVLWWLLVGPRPFQLAPLGGVLAFSAAFQVVVFGVVVWLARYRSKGMGGVVLFSVFFAVQLLQLRWVRFWSEGSPGQLPPEVLWIAGIVAVVGLLITVDGYRRWLVTEFD